MTDEQIPSTADPIDIAAIIEAYKTRWQTTPQPLVVPNWFPRLWQAQHPDRDLDEFCRQMGFDGYQTEITPDFGAGL